MKNKTDDEIIRILEESRIQATAQRIALYRYVLCESNHPTAEDVKKWADVNFPKISLATVYNTLNKLVQAGLAREFKFPDRAKLVYDARVSDHYHFLDEETGEIIDIAPEQVEITPKMNAEFQIEGIDILLRGRRFQNFT